MGITDPFPHSGCTTLNPICNGGTSCVCDPNASLTCSSDIHSTCDGFATTSPFLGGSCICGTNAGGGTSSACIGELPSCKATNFAGITDSTYTSATCQVKIETFYIKYIPFRRCLWRSPMLRYWLYNRYYIYFPVQHWRGSRRRHKGRNLCVKLTLWIWWVLQGMKLAFQLNKYVRMNFI